MKSAKLWLLGKAIPSCKISVGRIVTPSKQCDTALYAATEHPKLIVSVCFAVTPRFRSTAVATAMPARRNWADLISLHQGVCIFIYYYVGNLQLDYDAAQSKIRITK